MEEKLKIFFCEDDENLGMLLREYLQAKGYVTDLFSDGEAGYKGFTKGKYDLCVLDVMMPKKDGLQLCSEIKQDLRTGHIPVIIITAKSMVMHIKEGFQCGADDYIVKPFNMEVLLCRIREYLASRERLKELYGQKNFRWSHWVSRRHRRTIHLCQKLFGVIEQNLSNPGLNVEILCKGVGMGRANFYRKLKAITDLSPVDLIRNKRLEIAARMLLETDMNISEVSANIGFNSHAYFATCFKAMYGMSPTEYVQQNKKKSISCINYYFMLFFCYFANAREIIL